MASDEVVAEVSLPASSAPQLLVPPECPVSQSRGLSGGRHRSVTSIHGFTIADADVRKEGGALLIAPFPESQQQEDGPRTGEDGHEEEDRVLEEKLEGGKGHEEAPNEDRENEGGKGGANANESSQTLEVPGEARSQSAVRPQGQGEDAARQPAREAPGPGEGGQDDGPHQGRPDQGQGQEEVDGPDQEPVLQPLQPLG